MKAEQLRKSILQLAIQGKLVPQDPADEPASVLLERIRAEKQSLIKQGKIKKDKGDSVIFKGDDNCYYEKTGSEVKNITDEIDFDLPDGWEYIRLSTVCWLGDTKKTSGETLPYSRDLKCYQLCKQTKSFIGVADKADFIALQEDLKFLQNCLKTTLKEYTEYFKARFIDVKSIRKYGEKNGLNRGSVDYIQKKFITALAENLEQRDLSDGKIRIKE